MMRAASWKIRTLSVLAIFVIATSQRAGAAPGPTWVEQGPGPTLFGANVEGPGNHPVSGAVNAIAVDPTDPSGNTVYIGSVNGGVWKTTNFLTASLSGPTYTQLTDQQLPA